jgi:purine-binding chemotaxis protein CheW
MTGGEVVNALVVKAGTRGCAIPLQHVRETLRPLPIEPVAGVPLYLRGISLIRGHPVPVADLGALLGESDSGSEIAIDDDDGNDNLAGDRAARLVLLQLGQRQVAVAVSAVIGVRRLDSADFGALPPLLADAGQRAIEAVGVQDAELLLVLRAARLLPDDLWALLDRRGA